MVTNTGMATVVTNQGYHGNEYSMAAMATNAGIRSVSVTVSVAVILSHEHCLVTLTLLTLTLSADLLAS